MTSEHYFPSVLALHGLADETDCMGHAVAADWSSHGSHPRSFAEEEVTASLCGEVSSVLSQPVDTLHPSALTHIGGIYRSGIYRP